MIHNITYLKDTLGNNYLGIKISPDLVSQYLRELQEIIGEDDFKIYTDNQKKRDLGSYHITVISFMDYNKLSKEMGIDKFINSLEPVFSYEIDDIKMMGIGTATKNENRSYFVICESDKLNAIRDKYDLPKQDFHITIGFKWKDVHGVRKNQLIQKKDKFLKLLKSEYYNNDNWNFLKNIGNFDVNKNEEIIPIELQENRLKIKCDGYYLDISILDDERFWVMAKYPVDKDLPRLPETEISKILNKS